MEALEVSAKNVEEAVELALNKLELSRSEVEIEVLEEGKGGILGMGGEEAKVRVTPLTSVGDESVGEEERGGEEGEATKLEVDPEAIAAIAKEVVEKLLFLMKVPATVQLSGGESEESPLTLDIEDDDLGILIGRRGQTLSTLQYMVNFIASRKVKSGVRVIVDAAGYRKRRHEELQNLALRVADLVKSSTRSITLEPMPALERRVIHLALRDDPDLSTQSVGFGDSRKVVVSPKR